MAFDNYFKPKNNYDLIRLGRDYDGGYIVCKSIKNSKELISLGINNDWSFEKDYYKRINQNISTYDPTTNFSLLYDFFGKSLIRFFRLKQLLKSSYDIFDYYFFFKRKIKHHKLFVWYDSENMISLDKILGKSENDIFLKIDIEGFEYRILDYILKNQSRLNGLVIEFHDLDLHKKTVKEFIKNLNLELVYISPNNFSGVDQNGDPITIELTFSKNPFKINDADFSKVHFDYSNNPNAKQLDILFK